MSPATVSGWMDVPQGAAIVLSDGRIVSARATDAGGWVATVEWSLGGCAVAPAIDREDAAWLATAYVIGAIGGEP